MSINVFGAAHKTDSVRSASSSGGVFYAIAKETIVNGGHVYGAALITDDEGKWTCRHIKCDHIHELERILKSKYIPSIVEHTFLEIQALLQADETVLFCGTPCQVAGLISYLGKEYDKLTTVDLICHGVPTPLLTQKFINEAERIYHKQVIDVNFRDKKLGWRDYCFSTTLDDGSVIPNDALKLYMSDAYLRESCYHCKFKGVNRRSDITLGDFWGVENYLVLSPEDMFQGVSVIITQSTKGNDLINRVGDSITLYQSSIEVFTHGNQAVKKSALKPLGTAIYSKLFFKMNIGELIELHAKVNPFEILYKKIKRRLTKLYAILGEKRSVQQRLPSYKTCCGCMACKAVCPFDAIDIQTDAFGFQYPSVNNKCKKCGKCIAVCPVIHNKYIK